MKIENILDIKSVISNGNWKVFGIGGLPETRSEAHFVVDDFELICSRRSGDLKSVEEKIKVNVFDIDNNSKKGEDIISDENVIEYINSFSSEKRIAIYLFRSSDLVEKICKKNGWTLIAEKNNLFNKLDSRDFFFELLKKINYSREFEILELSNFYDSADNLFEEFGEKIVIQTFQGAGGKGTFIVGRNDYEKIIKNSLIEKDEKVLVTSFVEGLDIALTGCVTKDNGVLSGFARYQFVGLKDVVLGKEFSENSFCGNDWSIDKEYADDIQKQGEEIVQKIGDVLREEGFRGIFGIDFIYDKNNKKLVPLEINPRTLGSFPVETQFEILNQQLPLVGFHLLEFLEEKYEIVENLKTRERIDLKEECSHIILVNFLKRDLKIKNDLKGGVYQIEKDKLEFIRNGFQVDDIKDFEKEFILTAGVPSSSYVYKKNNQLVRIIWKKSIQVKNGKDIDDEFKGDINVVKNEIKEIIVNEINENEKDFDSSN